MARRGEPVAQTIAHYLAASHRFYTRPGNGIEEVENFQRIWAPRGRTPAAPP